MGINSLTRKNKIKGTLRERGRISVSEIVDEFGVSEVTARRDLEELQDSGALLRIYGGAVSREGGGTSGEFEFGEKRKRHSVSKRMIAEAALGLIEEGDTIFLDSGTTTHEMARLLKKRGREITVVTNSLPVIMELIPAETVGIFLIGGSFRRELNDFVSPFVREETGRLSFSKSFLGVDGISGHEGLTTTDLASAQVEEAVIANSRSIIIVADSSKIGRVSLIKYADIQRLKIPRMLITDSGASKKELEAIRKMGFTLKITVKTEREG